MIVMFTSEEKDMLKLKYLFSFDHDKLLIYNLKKKQDQTTMKKVHTSSNAKKYNSIGFYIIAPQFFSKINLIVLTRTKISSVYESELARRQNQRFFICGMTYWIYVTAYTQGK